MARLALLDPKNFAPDTGSKFKEGFVRVDQSCYTVHQDKAYEGQKQREPYTALKLTVTRLNEELEPITDADDNPLTEVLHFSLGGKSLASVHPGQGSSPDDEEAEDQGDELGVEGNTCFIAKADFKVHPNSGFAVFAASLNQIGYTPEHMARTWAPDLKGVIFHMKTWLSEQKMAGSDGVERPIPYKVADKFFPVKGAGKGAAAAGGTTKKGAGKAASSTGSAGNADAEKLLDPILMGLSETLDGQAITRKALSTKVSAALQEGNIDTKQHIPVLTLVKDNAWLERNGKKYDYTFSAEAGTITFGTPAEAAA